MKTSTHRFFLPLLSGSLANAALLLAGCAYSEPGHPVVYREPAPVAVVQDDYVYYPQYEVYYSNSRHQYGYREGNSWAWRSTPPRVAVNILASSPSVRMNFHDSPERHHAEVVRSYPHNWRQPEPRHDDHRDDHREDDHRH